VLGLAFKKGCKARYAVGIAGVAWEARVKPYAALRLDRTSAMRAFGRAGVFWASIRAWRLVPREISDENDESPRRGRVHRKFLVILLADQRRRIWKFQLFFPTATFCAIALPSSLYPFYFLDCFYLGQQ